LTDTIGREGLLDGLTPRQARFVEEYLVDSNATQAAIRAGFSAKTAPQSASRLLTNVKIAAAIADAKAPVLAANQLTLDEHLRELAAIRDAAKTELQFAAAVTAETNRGKAAGLYLEQPRDRSAMSDEELEAIIAGRATKPSLKLA
jgi:phage terminase small subunit